MADKLSREVLQLEFFKTLQNYQIALTSLATYWTALIVGIIVAYATEKLAFTLFFVLAIGISAYLSILIIFYLHHLQERLDEIIAKVQNFD